MTDRDLIVAYDEPILVTGASGFIGSRLVKTLLQYGFTNIRCLVRPSSNLGPLNDHIDRYGTGRVRIYKGNLQNRDDCREVAADVALVYHLAAGRGEKSYPDAFINSVVTTRNLLDELVRANSCRRFVNVSSFTVYCTDNLPRGGLLDETCELEKQPHLTGEAYCFAKVNQEQLVVRYGHQYGVPYVITRPGVVFGPGNRGLTGRVGIGTFGIFLHLGGSNRIPFTYVDNCAEAIALAGLTAGVDGEAFNIVDDELPRSRDFLKLYKKQVRDFRSLYLPKPVSYFLSYLWERYADWSEGQLPPTFNRKRWSSYWKGNRYSNAKLKELLGWRPKVGFDEASSRYFAYQRSLGSGQ